MKNELLERILREEMVLVDKPAGMTSFGVVARVRRKLSEYVGKKVKVGHTGTLDPFATGLLILMVGKGTKRCGEFLKKDKRYVAKLRLGYSSTTGDIEGEISKDEHYPSGDINSSGDITIEKIREVAKEFIGEVEQEVPRFSAVKIQGQRAYNLARKGVEVEMPKRKVNIYEMNIIDFRDGEIEFECFVSSGTYVRTLGVDLARQLGTEGYLTSLRRTKIGDYSVEEAVKLEEIMGK